MKNLILLSCFALFTSLTFCQKKTSIHITNDKSFNTQDSNTSNRINYGNFIRDGLVQKDGKIVILCSEATKTVFRINADGSYDSTFQYGETNFLEPGINSGVIQSDGKIVCVGDFGSYSGTTAYGIVRINSDGTVDNTFKSGFGFDKAASKIIIQHDDKLIVSGIFTTYNGVPVTDGLIRLNTDGSIDTSFHYVHHALNANPLNYNVWASILALPDDKILMAVSKSVYNNDSMPSTIIRLNKDGTDDLGFDSIKDWVNSFTYFTTDSDQNIISCWGRKVDLGQYYLIAYLKKYSSDGILDNTFDTTFNLDPNNYPSSNHSIYFTSDKKIIVATSQSFYYATHQAYVFNSNGIYDSIATKALSNFAVAGELGEVLIGAILPSSNNKFIILGQFVKYKNTKIWKAAKINEGSFLLDGSYNLYTNGGANGDIYTQAVLPNDEIFIGGSFTHYNGIEVSHIVKLNKDGVADNSFQPLNGFNDNVYAICADNNKVVVGGDFTTINFDSLARICRLNADGSIDNSFNTGAGFNNRVNVIVRQPDGKYIIGGNFTSFNNKIAGRLIRLNTDGSVDNTFNIGTGADNEVKTICIQPNGKVLIGGSFTMMNNSQVGSLVRLNTNGSLDNLSQKFVGNVNTIAYQTNDDEFIIGGDNLDGHNTAVFRCTNDGVIDTSFKSPYNSDNLGSVNAIDILSNGMIAVGGNAKFYHNDIGNLNLFVYLKDSANPVSSYPDSVSYYTYDLLLYNFPPTVYNINHQRDNKFIVSGMYSDFVTEITYKLSTYVVKDVVRNNISRVYLNEGQVVLPIKLLSFNAFAENNNTVKLYWSTSAEIHNKQFLIERSADGKDYKPIGSVSGVGNSNTLIDYQYVDKYPINGINYYKLRQVDFDGRYEDSKIVSVNISFNKEEITVYPTIFTTQLNIQASDPNKKYTVSLVSLKGNTLGNFAGNISVINLNVNKTITSLSKGTYLLVFRTKDRLVESHKIVKE